eukprot:1269275-Rhodomonas_salina.1
MQVKCGDCSVMQLKSGKLGTVGCLAAALPRGSLGRGCRGLWLERRCWSTLAEISARNGSNGVVRGA